MTYKILTINPGSTSTKIGLFQGEECVYSANVAHEAEELKKYATISDQLGYRRDMILALLAENHVDLSDVDAYVGRGGGLMAVEGGVYEVDDTLLDHARRGANGVQHPANLGSQIADELAKKYGKPAFVVNPPDTDELCDLARVTGIKGVYRNVHLHALNLKETAIRHAESQGKKYEECNFVVCHIGGGISISAHEKGSMIDGTDIVGGEGPMAPTRCGSVPVAELLRYMKDKEIKDVKPLCTKTGGFVSLLGTSDAREVKKMASEGNKAADRAWNAMIYQITKSIGAMAAALHGKVDGILLGGGMVHNADLVEKIEEACGFIAPVYPYPGEFELEAMNAGAARVLAGLEVAKKYTGVPRWKGFEE
ncbi:MAG: butyrate kinase [Erysipelotrichales bacterium]|nr:butyrate kinase [Erysipelotrichales bacterium]MBR3693018.1 butyrate kinase [Erysipelotrichales bacterium]